jgi:hypothetical protein
MNFRIALSALALALCVAASAQNILVNGSFEDPTVNGTADDGTGLYWYGLGPVAPWTNGNLLVLQNRTPFWSGTDGTHYANLQYSQVFTIGQDVNTVAGQQYRLTFDLSSDMFSGDLADCKVGVRWNGVTLATFTPTTHAGTTLTWDSESLLIDSTQALGHLDFYDVNNFTDFNGPLLDNIQLVAVPEPASMSLLGLGAVALLRRKSDRS